MVWNGNKKPWEQEHPGFSCFSSGFGMHACEVTVR